MTVTPAALVIFAAASYQPPVDKSSYTIASPTPRELMRDMSTDRPDATESPYTVDAGHVQVEMSLAQFSRELDGGRVDTWELAPINFKVGVLNSLDVQLLFTPYIQQETDLDPDASGIGDLTLRTKFNVIGNDSGPFAAAVMPFVKIPTGGDQVSNGRVEGGLIVPVAFELPNKFSLGLMLELDAVRNDTDGYDAELVHTATLSRELWGDLSGYVEYIGVTPLRSGRDYAASFSSGLAYAVTSDIQLDVGGVVGLTPAAEDLVLFAGISLRY